MLRPIVFKKDQKEKKEAAADRKKKQISGQSSSGIQDDPISSELSTEHVRATDDVEMTWLA